MPHIARCRLLYAGLISCAAVILQPAVAGAESAGPAAVEAQQPPGLSKLAQGTTSEERKPALAVSNPDARVPGTPPRSRVRTLDDMFAEVASQVPEFGGLYVSDDGMLQVVFTDTSPNVVEAARQAVIEVFGPERIRRGGFHPVLGKYGFLQLHDMRARIRNVLALPGVVLLDTDERANRLKIGLSDITAQAEVERRLAALNIPLDAVLFEERAPMRMFNSPDPQDRIRPVVGGLQISVNGHADCTIGFVRRSGVDGFVTASHCSATMGTVDGSAYHQPDPAAPMTPSNFIGTETFDPPFLPGGSCPAGRRCRFSDSTFVAMAQGITGHQGQIVNPSDPNFPGNFSIQADTLSLSGDSVMKVGRTTGYTGGKVDSTCVDLIEFDSKGNDTGITLLCQNVGLVFAAPGDSGGPVFQYPGGSDPYNVLLAGVLWGADGKHLGYSPLAMVQAELQLGSSFTDVDHPPVAAITSPLNNAVIPYGGLSSVTFNATATDFEQGPNCCTFSWESDKDGFMGVGASRPFFFFSPGPRKVTVTATDSSGNKGQASIHLHAANSAPKLWIVKPSANATLQANSTYVFEGTSFDTESFAPLPCNNLLGTAATLRIPPFLR